MDNKGLAQQIVFYLGGASNIQKVECCFTRLRFHLFDNSKIEKKELEKIGK